ncbi:hypothetical protein HU811_20840 [Pseudomonas sp. SWRI196]|uniref:Delta-60 repeat domain-containing protein n=1 Tax=Pseudomonas tehranensis TaxID=2745502 RepID=A0ABR6UX78_9PSED|nr:hypothetical protein [Pseudomonas tehranensis]MBC3349098.1 hypothetical protein [Pseudomonas tehranensis]
MSTDLSRNAGSLDPTFGSGGKVFPSNPADPLMLGSVWGLTIAPDHKVLIAGRFGRNYSIIRLNPDGSADRDFGEYGVITGSFAEGYASGGESISLLDNGQILLTGVFKEDDQYSPSLPAAARFYSDGRLDTRFGFKGHVVIRLPLDQSNPAIADSATRDGSGRSSVSATVLPDGKIWMTSVHRYSFIDSVGVLMRLESNGNLDLSLNNGKGFVIVRYPECSTEITTHLIQPDGKIVVAGIAIVGGREAAFTARYVSDGTADPSFGSAGFVLTEIERPTQILSLALQKNGNLVAAGSTTVAPTAGFLLSLSPDGRNDPLFNRGVPLLTLIDDNPYGSQWIGVATDDSGKIVVTGATLGGEEADILLARYLSDASLDGSFGDGTGIVRTKIGSGADHPQAIALQEDGRIVVIGMFFSESGFRPVVLRFKN